MGCYASTSACKSAGYDASDSSSEGSASSSEGPVNINEASVDDLMRLPGIGRGRAQKILEHREANGPFAGFEDLAAVPGIGTRVIEQLSGQISFGAGEASYCSLCGLLSGCTCPQGLKPVAPCSGSGWCPPWGGAAAHEAVFFPDSEEGAGLGRLLDVLSGAKRRLDVAVFAIGHAALATALVDAKKRGVAVRVVTDDMQAKESNSQVALLKKGGVQVRMDSSEKFHMHHKFVVVDESTLISGSLNWTHAALKKGYENVVISRKAASLCRHFSAEFDRLWTAFAAGSVAQAPEGRLENNVAALFFPEPTGTNVELMRSQLEAARSSIDAAVFTLTNDALVNVLIAKHRAGLRVRVMTDNRQEHVLGGDAERLRKSGIEVRTDKSWYAMHHKFAVIDGSSLINGSFNWTSQATKGNQEDALLFRNAKPLASSFAAEFDRLWKEFK